MSGAGESERRIRSDAHIFRAVNFQKDSYGDLDLHQFAYSFDYANAQDDEGLWRRSLAVTYDNVLVRVPAAEDRIALAIAHSAHEGHLHSDWLVDVDDIIDNNQIDWNSLRLTLQRRNLLVPATSALTYLAQEIGTPIPNDALQEMLFAADRHGFSRRLSLLELKPRTDLNWISRAGRIFVGIVRRKRARRDPTHVAHRIWKAVVARRVKHSRRPSLSYFTDLELKADFDGAFEIVVLVHLPSTRRRVEMELSTGGRHLALLRYRKVRPFSGPRQLKFRGRIKLIGGERTIRIEARPVRLVRRQPTLNEVALFGPLPFFVSKYSSHDHLKN
jgi:hypothetical protein